MNIRDYAKTDDRGRYAVVPGEIYPATIGWITSNRDALAEALAQPDAVLITRALNGDTLAAFVVRARQNVTEALAVPVMGWQLAVVPRSQVVDDDVALRARALETARRFFTEMLHQSVGGGALHIRILKDEAWKL